MKEIAIIWCTEDVFEVRDDLTEEQAGMVLYALKKHHDANIGINWDVIRDMANTLYPKARGGL